MSSSSLIDKPFDGRTRLKGLDFMNWPIRDGIRADPAGNMGIVPKVRNEPGMTVDMEESFALLEAVSTLTAEEKEMISSIYVTGVGLKKVASAMGVSVPKLKKRIVVALAKMRAILEEPPVVEVKVEKDPTYHRVGVEFPLALTPTAVN